LELSAGRILPDFASLALERKSLFHRVQNPEKGFLNALPVMMMGNLSVYDEMGLNPHPPVAETERIRTHSSPHPSFCGCAAVGQ
jgi:hypothetical protein